MNKVSFLHSSKIVELAAGKKQSNKIVGKRQAIGDITFAGQPAANDTITINGTVFTYVAAGAVGNQINIGASTTVTIDNTATVLNASVVAGVALSTYSNVGGTKLHVKAKVYGSAGNAITLAETGANTVVSGATLTGGVDADLYNLDAETNALVTITGTTVTEFDLPAGEEGQEQTAYLTTLGAGSNAQINGAFVGGTKITFTAAGQYARLKFLGASWVVLSQTGALS